ncbi:MAG: rhodanese-like domain-containing protein [Halodesulfurarchaeum sp.]
MASEIEPGELEQLLDGDHPPPLVVDIRSPAAFAERHIPGSENIPFEALPASMAELQGADHIVTVCPHGKASKQAVRLIESYEGIEESTRVESLAGGLEAWSGPIESSRRT